WDNHYELVHTLRVLQNLRRGLDDSLEVLEEFKKSHRRNTIIRFQSSTLKRYIGDAKSSPQKLTGKKSRIINPVVHHLYHDHDDSDDYGDPPSSSPSDPRQLFYD
ncbi:5379_t:CDS:2, partial [Acaulospora morrowiae]